MVEDHSLPNRIRESARWPDPAERDSEIPRSDLNSAPSLAKRSRVCTYNRNLRVGSCLCEAIEREAMMIGPKMRLTSPSCIRVNPVQKQPADSLDTV